MNKHNFDHTEFLLFVTMFRNRPLEVILWETVLKIWSKSEGGHQCRSVTSIKLLCIYMEITLRHRCSLVNLLHVLKDLFIRTPLKVFCFCMFKLWFLCFCITSLMWTFIFFPTVRFSTKKLYCNFTQKLLEEVQVLVVLYIVSLQIY